MKLEDYILKDYPTVEPYIGINAIEENIKGKNYLVVMDKCKTYYGILTPSDVISRPHKLVIDCLSKKERVRPGDSFAEVYGKFSKTPSEALPVFHENEFIGIIEKDCALQKLKYRVDELYKASVISKEVNAAFLHNLSHEVRTPLNQIVGFMGVISELAEEPKKSEDKEYLEIIRNGCEQFLSVMNDLIDLSLLNVGDPVPIYREHTLIEPILRELKRYYELDALYSGYQVDISYQNPDPDQMAYIDEKKVKQILFNLIDEAIRHGKGKKVIEYGCIYPTGKKSMSFYVRNIHAPINEVQIAPILNAFENGDGTDSFNQERIGSGMEMINQLVKVLQGDLRMETDEKNILTTYLTIPLND
ncbi:MAG: histidine kinase dimerization/phospho-acceptor domain-containing protein [Bacteroidales bacterium]|nr:histidine kinase dimerization/phospho-acceptor domain-containing protein [Bacteroidales bacterium]